MDSWKQAVRPVVLAGLVLSGGLFVQPVLAQSEGDVRRDATVLAVEKAMPSVVNIATSSMVEYRDFYDDLMRDFFGQPRARGRVEEQVQSLGSGVIVDEEGYILSNWHVVSRGSRVQVKLADGRLYEADKIFATTRSDLALLKLRAKPGEKFPAIKLAPDDDLLLGETVIALGNPFGLGGSVSRGILSSKTRRPESGNEPLNIADWLQTDAAINPGNSGGPLINLRGELIGLNVAVYRQGQGIGFAIPVKQVSAALAQFFSPELNYSLWFGAALRPGTLPLEISAVQPGSPADRVGLKPGQRVLEVNGRSVKSLVEFNEFIVGSGGGREAKLLVLDGSRRRPVTVAMTPFEDVIRQRTGLTLTELNPSAAARLGLRAGQGMVVQTVERGSPAARAEVQAGMVLTAINQNATGELRDAGLALIGVAPGGKATLSLLVPRQLGGGYVQLRQGTVEIELR
jgi:S1-C subfamily serine protease